jgi:Zn-dependent M28 family amino/carboxypeptidase
MKVTLTRSAVRLHTATLTLFALFISTFALNTSSQAQQRRAGQGREAAAPSMMSNAPRNPTIARIVSEINAGNIERTIRKLVSFGTRNTLSAQDNPARGIGAARDWLYSEFQKASETSGGRMKVEKQTFEQAPGKYPRIARTTTLTNVVATLRGTQPASENRLYVVSGHYDSMCTSPTDAECDAPGANDDASGTAAVLEMARVMAKYEFDATIIFMAVAGEEQGLVGSGYFAEQAKQKNWNIEAMFTNDIVGNTLGGNGVRDRRTLRVFSEGVPSSETNDEANVRRGVGGENDSAPRQLARFIKETAARYVPSMNVMMIYRRDRYLRGGDHIPFLERGYAAVRFTEPNEEYKHQHQNVRVENGVQYGDLPEFVDFAYIAQVARVNAANLAALALAPARPKSVGIVTTRLTNDTDLKWDANTEPDLAGYEIVWRDTVSPVWTNSRAVGRVTSYTMPGMSKDNYFFGVRAVDRQGNRSPVSFPRPMR